VRKVSSGHVILSMTKHSVADSKLDYLRHFEVEEMRHKKYHESYIVCCAICKI
jgi:hypothetical protein